MSSPTRSSTTLLISMTTLEMMAKSMESMEDLLILIQIGEVDSLTPIGRLETIILIMVRKEDIQILRSTG